MMDFNTPLSYADYQRLRSQKPAQWSEDDLARFLIIDGYFAKNTIPWVKSSLVVQENFLKGEEFLIKKHNAWQFIANIVDTIFLIFYIKTKNPAKKSILIQNAKYNFMFSDARHYYNLGLITQGKRDRLFAVSHGMGFLGINDVEHYVVDYIKDKKMEHLHQLIGAIEKKLKIAKPDYIVLIDDCHPVARAIIVASRKLGIVTLVIQHGAHDWYTPIYNCKAADYVLAWGNYFKDVFVKHGIRKPEDVFILGYPKEYKILPVAKQPPYKVCYLGQDYERYNKDLLQIKLDTVKEISNMCKKLGLDFIYRPHPSDDRDFLQEKLPGVAFTHKEETLYETFAKNDIMVSFSSTALAEAAMTSKISLQLINYPDIVKTDNLETLGACNKSFTNTGELEKYLFEISKAKSLDKFEKKFNNYYIETGGNLAKRFLEIMQEIEKNGQ